MFTREREIPVLPVEDALERSRRADGRGVEDVPERELVVTVLIYNLAHRDGLKRIFEVLPGH